MARHLSTNERLLAAGKRYRYPRIVLAPRLSIAPGETGWYRFIQEQDEKTVKAAFQRIEQFEKKQKAS